VPALRPRSNRPTGAVLQLASMEVIRLQPRKARARVVPEGLTRCPVCRGFRGRALFPKFDEPPGFATFEATVRCWCDGLRCGACGKGRMHQPTTNYYDTRSGSLIHVPYFMGMAPCSKCGQRDWRQLSNNWRDDA
jgi:hypothetical protein